MPEAAPECPSCHALLRPPRPLPEVPPAGQEPSLDTFVDFHMVASEEPGPSVLSGVSRGLLAWRPAVDHALASLADALLSVTLASTLLAVAAAASPAARGALAAHLGALWLDAFLLVDVLGRGGAVALGLATLGMRACGLGLEERASARAIAALVPSPVQALFACAAPVPGVLRGESPRPPDPLA